MTPLFWSLTLLLVTSVGAAAVYGLGYLHAPPSARRSLFKTLPVAVLACAVPAFGGPVLLAIALGLSALGDLALSRAGQRAFIAGLAAFLLAHVAYMLLFWPTGGVGGILPWQGAALVFVVVTAGGALAWLWPGLGALRGAVTVYVVAIAMMAVAAILRTGTWPLLAGAALFMLSDLVLGAETFRLPASARRWTAPAIWVSYYLAQALIAAAFLCPHFTT